MYQLLIDRQLMISMLSNNAVGNAQINPTRNENKMENREG